MKKYLIFLLVIISFTPNSNIYSQEKDSIICKPYIDSISNQEYYIFVDSMPEYPGGQQEMMKFFMTNFNYSEPEAFGKIIVEFLVNKEGKMTNFKIKRGLVDELDKEAIRVMRMMPKWKPGKCNNKLVNVKISIPWIIELK